MTDSAAAAATTTAATTTPASDAAPAATTTPAPAAGTGTILTGADSAATKDSTETDAAQAADQADTDKPADGSQSSDDKDPTDTDKKDGEGEESEDGNQEQPAYQDFTVPEGLELDNDALNEALPVLQEYKVPQEAAQKLIDVASSMLSKAAKTMADQHNKVVDGWKAETVAAFGKEGDAKFQELAGRANEVVKQFFNEDQRKVLSHYGLGNHPAFFAMAVAIAEGTGEDRLTVPGAGNGTQGEKTLGQIWYPEST